MTLTYLKTLKHLSSESTERPPKWSPAWEKRSWEKWSPNWEERAHYWENWEKRSPDWVKSCTWEKSGSIIKTHWIYHFIKTPFNCYSIGYVQTMKWLRLRHRFGSLQRTILYCSANCYPPKQILFNWHLEPLLKGLLRKIKCILFRCDKNYFSIVV
jgi:hypothetical protein